MSTHSSDEHGIRYEKSDVRPWGVVRIGLIVAAVALATAGVLRPMMSFLGARQARFDRPLGPMAVPVPDPPPYPEQSFDNVAKQGASRRPPEPRLQERPFDDVAKLRAVEKDALEGYGWVDEKAGVVRIPIDEAIRILARRGLPARAEAPAPSPQPPPAAKTNGAGGHK